MPDEIFGIVGDDDGDDVIIFGDAEIIRGGDDPLPKVGRDVVVEGEVLIKLAWCAIIA